MTPGEASWLPGTGGMAERVRGHDWAATPLGPIGGWPPALRVAVGTVLDHPLPMLLAWGPDLIAIHNDAYRPLLGSKPEALGRPFLEVWEEVRGTLAPQVARALAGETTRLQNAPFTLLRQERPERAFLNYTLSPVRDETGAVAGLINTAFETTGQVLADREREDAFRDLRAREERQAFMLALGDAMRGQSSAKVIMEVAARLLGERLGASRVMFAEFDEARGIADIFFGWFADGAEPFPAVVRLEDYEGPILDELRAGRTVRVDDAGQPPFDRPDLAAIAELGVRALLSVPLVLGGRLVVNLSIHQHAARRWTEDEVTLVQETAERLWADLVRARAEAALRESEERLRTALSIQTVGVVFWDSAFRLTDANEAFLRMTRCEKGEVLGKTWQELTPAEFHPASLNAVAELRARGEITPYEKQCFRCDGSRFWGLFATRALGDGAVEFVLDVTDRKNAELALRESEGRFRAFAENSADTIWIASRDGRRLEYLSPAFERMFGEERARVTADLRRWAELLHPEDREETMRAMPRAFAGEMAIAHYRVVRPSDGRLVHLRDTGFPVRDEAGAVVRVAGIVQDVTDIAAAQEGLEAEKERFRTLAEGIPQLVWRSCEEGLWTWSSPQWQAYTGQSQEASRGRGWLEAVHPEDRERTMAAWAEARPHGRLEVEYRVRRASDGAWRWHGTRSVPVRNGGTAEQPEGRIVEWLGTTTDIDDLKRLQAEQAVLVAELQHRTRNLLAVVRNVARRSIPPQPGRDEYDERLAALGRVQGLLARTERYAVALRDLVEAELQAAGDGVSDRVVVEGPPVDLPGEGAQPVALALHELATNAVKYGAIAQPGGRLSVTWQVEEGARLLIAWRESGVPMPGGPPARRGYGSELITRALPYQMRAETALEFTPDGVRCLIALPAGVFRARRREGS